MIFKGVYEKGLSKGLFQIEKIKDICKTCCYYSEIKVIDFDETAKYVKSQDPVTFAETPASVDCLIFNISHSTIDLIEMKSVDKFIKYHLMDTNRASKEQIISKQMEKFNLSKKYIDSIKIIKWVEQQFNQTEVSNYFKQEYPIFVVLIDESDYKLFKEDIRKRRTYTGFHARVKRSIEDYLKKYLNDINGNMIISRLWTEKKFDDFYSKLDKLP